MLGSGGNKLEYDERDDEKNQHYYFSVSAPTWAGVLLTSNEPARHDQ